MSGAMSSSASEGADTAGDLVVVVDARDRAIGVAPKLAAHRAGILHRAVSVVLFDHRGRVLLQRRAREKYHSPGLWSNTACGHPRPGETVLDAALRRLQGEMGIAGCRLVSAGSFLYRVAVEGGLVEHELDHVLVGHWAGTPAPAASEVAEWCWLPLNLLEAELRAFPCRYTAWLRPVLALAAVQQAASVSGEGAHFSSTSPLLGTG